jgi:hypothetical protein
MCAIRLGHFPTLARPPAVNGDSATIDQGLASRVLNRCELDDVLERHRGRRGAGRLAAVLVGGDSKTISRSRAERAFLKLIRDARLPGVAGELARRGVSDQ